uniref:Sterol carrier protein 2a n=1 Tax=Eptatretus burgeri TaxID=7764 RepID=A0A8C4QWV2_EPTBU
QHLILRKGARLRRASLATYVSVLLSMLAYVCIYCVSGTGNSTCGQRAIYHSLGMTGIPIFNVNNNCSSGSTALFGARQVIEGGLADCVLALGFEKMDRGPLTNKFPLHTNPLDHHVEVMGDIYGFDAAPIVPQMFSNAGREHSQKYGTKPEHFAKVAWKNHKHASNNPYVHLFFDVFYSLFLNLFIYLLLGYGAAAAVLVSEEFMRRHGLEDRAVEILVQEMVTDTPETFSTRNAIDLVGYKLTEEAARRCFRRTGLSPFDVQVVELHDCFSANELISYEALGLCPPGKEDTVLIIYLQIINMQIFFYIRKFVPLVSCYNFDLVSCWNIGRAIKKISLLNMGASPEGKAEIRNVVCPRKIMAGNETQEFEWLNHLKTIVKKVDGMFAILSFRRECESVCEICQG